MQKFLRFIKKHRVESALVAGVVILAAFLRLYRISDYMTFLGDEGRDVMVAKGILEGNLTFLGPRASAGDFFLGPAYYYMIAPFLWLARLDPVGPAIMVALFGIATVFLVYFVGKKFFGTSAGIMSAFLYAVSPLVIAYSRSSWNPNPMPFFSLLSLYLLFVAVKKNNIKLFFGVGFLLGIAIQLHYLTTFLGVIVFAFILIGNLFLEKKGLLIKYVKQYGAIAIGFLIGLSPFLLFEIKNKFPNTKTIFNFIFVNNGSSIYPPQESFSSHVTDVFFRIFGRLVTSFPPPDQIAMHKFANLDLWYGATIALAVVAIGSLFFIKDKLKILLLGLWLVFGVILFGFYKKSIYDYYFGFMFPLPFLLIGNLFAVLSENKKFKKAGSVIAAILFIVLMGINLWGNPFRFEPNKQKDQAKNIAEFVLSQTSGKPFNFALITGGNSDHLYRYFLEIENRAPVTIENTDIDPQRKSVTDQLLVICELKDCHPLGNSLWEVAGFGRAEIAGEWDLIFVKVFKLVPFKDK